MNPSIWYLEATVHRCESLFARYARIGSVVICVFTINRLIHERLKLDGEGRLLVTHLGWYYGRKLLYFSRDFAAPHFAMF